MNVLVTYSFRLVYLEKLYMNKKILVLLLAASVCVNIICGVVFCTERCEKPVERDTVYIESVICDTLSEWDLFTLALMKVESDYDSLAVSSAGAKGYFQITPIYVKEVNRIHKTDYTFDQVTDFDTAYEIFDLMQKAHNPCYDMEKALTLHNGAHEWYHKRVYKEMSRIKLYEEMREKVKNTRI